MKSYFDEIAEKMIGTRQRSASLEQDTRWPCLFTEIYIPTDTKTRTRTEGAAAADHTKHDNSCFAKRVQVGPTNSISFDMKDEPPTLPRRDEVLVDKGAAAPKPSLSPVKMHTRTAAGSLNSAGTVSRAMMTIFHQPHLWFCLTEEVNSKNSNQYATDPAISGRQRS